jgi:hypothetical protein
MIYFYFLEDKFYFFLLFKKKKNYKINEYYCFKNILYRKFTCIILNFKMNLKYNHQYKGELIFKVDHTIYMTYK